MSNLLLFFLTIDLFLEARERRIETFDQIRCDNLLFIAGERKTKPEVGPFPYQRKDNNVIVDDRAKNIISQTVLNYPMIFTATNSQKVCHLNKYRCSFRGLIKGGVFAGLRFDEVVDVTAVFTIFCCVLEVKMSQHFSPSLTASKYVQNEKKDI